MITGSQSHNWHCNPLINRPALLQTTMWLFYLRQYHTIPLLCTSTMLHVGFCFFLLTEKSKNRWNSETDQGWGLLMFFWFLCSSPVLYHLLSVHDTSPCHVCKQTGLTAHPSLGPWEFWLHLLSSQLPGPDNTNHQNRVVHKPRIQPSGCV